MEHKLTFNDFAKMIDHSLLHPTLTDEELQNGCQLAIKYNVATVCVKPYAVSLTRELLQNTDVKLCTVIGFPHGNSSIQIKTAEALETIKNGASEIDMVINIGKAVGGDWLYLKDEINHINKTCLDNGAILKVIYENDYLTDEQIIRLCEICSQIKPAFVKTSTGYGFVKQPNGYYNYKGATDHHLILMRKHCHPDIQIKAAGGIRTLNDLLRVRSLGVNRIGAVATQAILEKARGMFSGLLA